MKEKLAEALQQAVKVIEQWHGKEVFDIYYNHAPEMKLIRDALAGWEAKEASISGDEVLPPDDRIFFADYIQRCVIDRGAMTYSSLKDAITAWDETKDRFGG